MGRPVNASIHAIAAISSKTDIPLIEAADAIWIRGISRLLVAGTSIRILFPGHGSGAGTGLVII